MKNDFFISSKKLFSFWRYSKICISDFPSSFPLGHCFRGWSKINLKVYDVINCLNKNLITRFIWYIDKERCDIETLSSDRVLISSICMKKPYRKYAPKANPRPLFNFGK